MSICRGVRLAAPRLSLGLLGMPALSLALAITTVSVLSPRELAEAHDIFLLAVSHVVAGEGLMALSLPLWIPDCFQIGPEPLWAVACLVHDRGHGAVCCGAGAAAIYRLDVGDCTICVGLLRGVLRLLSRVSRPVSWDIVPRPRFGRSKGSRRYVGKSA